MIALTVASESPAAPPRRAAACPVSFDSVKLVLRDPDRRARADYVIADDCEPVLKSVVYSSESRDAVVRDRRPSPSRYMVPSAGATLPGTSSVARSGSATDGHACRIDVWEEDVAGVPMITLRNSTSWEVEGGKIVGARIHEVGFANLDWWHVDGKPSARIAYVREPFTALSSAIDSYHCDGKGPLSRYVCEGPSYAITLQAEILFDGGGVCSGQGRSAGKIVPGGRVKFEVVREE